jgi:hypothetical protein
MPIAFAHRNPTRNEIERLRLILSTYQDGTGMLADKSRIGLTLPGWRDFERSVALAFKGEAQESKSIFDVLLTDPDNPDTRYGLSCKMRGELNRIDRDGRVTIEVSNSSGQFWDYLYMKGVYQTNYREKPFEVGAGLIEVVESWYLDAQARFNSPLDLSRSSYLVLSWNKAGWYQLHQFPLKFPSPGSLKWYCPTKLVNNTLELSRRINGDDEYGPLFEWYGESGGQLKYYPFASTALWSSNRFRLEPLENSEHGIIQKAAAYFPELWNQASSDDSTD